MKAANGLAIGWIRSVHLHDQAENPLFPGATGLDREGGDLFETGQKLRVAPGGAPVSRSERLL